MEKRQFLPWGDNNSHRKKKKYRRRGPQTWLEISPLILPTVTWAVDEANSGRGALIFFPQSDEFQSFSSGCLLVGRRPFFDEVLGYCWFNHHWFWLWPQRDWHSWSSWSSWWHHHWHHWLLTREWLHWHHWLRERHHRHHWLRERHDWFEPQKIQA